jgi:RsiW-degrading membrane proteinase PrsW (M82 family)
MKWAACCTQTLSKFPPRQFPLLTLFAASCLATAIVQKQTIGDAAQAPVAWRVANALVSYATYIWQMLWPTKLALFYPHPEDRIPVWQIWAAAALIGGVTALVLAQCKKHRYLVTGWGLSIASAQGRGNVAAALYRERTLYQSRRSYSRNR